MSGRIYRRARRCKRRRRKEDQGQKIKDLEDGGGLEDEDEGEGEGEDDKGEEDSKVHVLSFIAARTSNTLWLEFVAAELRRRICWAKPAQTVRLLTSAATGPRSLNRLLALAAKAPMVI